MPLRPFRSFSRLALAIVSAVWLVGCGPHAQGSLSSAAELQVDQAETISGVPDDGRDPAVLAIDVGDGSVCSGTLVAPNLVLTARRCVSVTVDAIACPSTAAQILKDRPPSTLRVLAGDEASTAREVARGATVVELPGDSLCGLDIALIVLDQSVAVAPLAIAGAPVAAGDHVTTVGFGQLAAGSPPGTKLLREHAEAPSVSSSAEFLVDEAACEGDVGGPALDETTGQVVGVVSRGGATCDGSAATDVYTSPSAFLPLLTQGLELSAWAIAKSSSVDAGAGASKKTADAGTWKLPSDIGDACTSAADCGAAVCVIDGGKGYCSRSCGTGDRCPDHYHCTATSPSQKVCVQTS